MAAKNAVLMMVDEFSILMAYDMTDNDPLSWQLEGPNEGTNDKVRKCAMSGAPDTQAMPTSFIIKTM